MYCVAILRLQTRYVNFFRPPDKSADSTGENEKSILHDAYGGMARRARPAVGHPLKDSPLVPGGTTWLINERDQRFTARAFSKWFGKRCRDAATAPISPRATEGGHATDGRGEVVRDADGRMERP